ncbi:PREDICTED: protein transport protein Sec24-like CEF [Nestor notabilis]|uniref:protein transport protein Sec24-like CEF n=1 Tax=Nestor notabilis TaxID=176057 RepID=UPI0005231067|nr:PREDICTED: protein transport protein Sec24-like CEF [Nestor notabilis]
MAPTGTATTGKQQDVRLLATTALKGSVKSDSRRAGTPRCSPPSRQSPRPSPAARPCPPHTRPCASRRHSPPPLLPTPGFAAGSRGSIPPSSRTPFR